MILIERIAPQQVIKETLIWYLYESVDFIDIVCVEEGILMSRALGDRPP